MSEQELTSSFNQFLSSLRTFIRKEVQNEITQVSGRNQELPRSNQDQAFNALHGMDLPPQVYREGEKPDQN